MQNYKRKITYFYQYHNGNVGSTAGFLKLEIRGDKVKIIINIQEPSGLPFKEASLYFYHEAGDHLAAIKVDEIESMNGILTYQNRTDWQQIFDTGRDLYTFDGVAVVYNDSHYYIGDFKDRDRRDYALVKKERRQEDNNKINIIREEMSKESVTGKKEPVKTLVKEEEQAGIIPEKDYEESEQSLRRPEDLLDERQQGEAGQQDTGKDDVQRQEENNIEAAVELSPQSETTDSMRMIVDSLFGEKDSDLKNNTLQNGNEKDVFEKCEDCPYHKKHLERQEQVDVFEKMLQEYPKLPMYGATELFDCVRIHPKDIGKLDMRNWKLGVNSFLTHGFYTYQYLLLGKMRFDDGSEHSIIGVPGVYSNREKYLANMFGFDQFIPVKKTGVKTGEFGYWIVEISPYLQ